MRIYVGGLSYTTDSEGLRALFATKGTVSDSSIVEDRTTGQSRGFGFVEMPDAAEARAAITQLNGHSLDGRSLLVNEAKPREDSGRNGSNRSR